VSLTIESDLHCVDSFRLEPDIIVEPSDLGIPNVFSPDGDGINDYFIPFSKSLRSISVEIFSRSGIRVYNFIGEGDELAAWKGWDGNVNDSSAKASPGVYYYVIRALGWDDIRYDGKPQRGFVYLYR
jgi:gliding motility-associated-like protein